MPTTKKTTTRTASATTKKEEIKAVSEEQVEDTKETVKKVVTRTAKTETKSFASGDRILCQSITAGQLIYYSTKTKERYEWSNYGDTAEVLYEDLLSMKSAKSNFIFEPLFVIAEESLISQPAWSKVKELYESVEIVEDAEDYLNQTPAKLKALLLQAPDGVRNTIKITASQMINNGELDSIGKIKVLDEVLGTNMLAFVS